jgi:hypothetical protein
MEDMLVRYIKHLVQITTSMSSFYVNIGLYRLLHEYSTAEVRRTYEWVSEHFAGDEEYRVVKGALINRLQERFERFLSTFRTRRGEVRFEVLDRQADWQELVEECLSVFTPWSTSSSCWVPTNFEPGTCTATKLLQKLAGSRDLDRIEMYRCHAFIDPCCYGHLAKGLGLAARRDRLSLPKFFLKNEKPGESGSAGNPGSISHRRPVPSGLTEAERGVIAQRLETEAIKRERAVPQVLSIVVHGRECLRWELAREGKQSLEIRNGTKLIEIWSESEGERVLLATHMVCYTSSQGIAESKHVLDLGARRELLLHTFPVEGGAVVKLECNPVLSWLAWNDLLGSFDIRPGPLVRYALASVCLILIGLGLGMVWHRNDLAQQRSETERVSRELVQEQAARAALERQLRHEQGTKSVASFMLMSGAAGVRGPGPGQEPVVTIPQNTQLIALKLPVSAGQQPSYSAVLKPLFEEREILRENLLKATTRDGGTEVIFAVPASLLESSKRYVVTLYRINKSSREERVDIFTFYAVKK